MNDEQRCPDERFGLRCELVRGHQSAHVVRNGDAFHHWRNRGELGDGALRVSFDWAEPETNPTGC